MHIKDYMEQFKYEEAEPAGGAGSLMTGGTGEPEAEPEAVVEDPLATINEGWLSGVNAELAKDPSMLAITSLEGMVKSYVSGQKMIGKDKLILPDEHGSKEDWNQVYDKLGRPSRDKYDVDFGESNYGEDFKNEFLDKAHESGVLPKQAAEMFNFWHSKVDSAQTQYAEESTVAQEKELAALKEEWGSGYDKNLKTAQIALKQFADESVIEYLEDTGLGNDPALIKLFSKIGNSLNEDTFSRDVVSHFGMTKTEAQQQIDDIMSNEKHPYYDSNHQGHKEAVRAVEKCFGVVNS